MEYKYNCTGYDQSRIQKKGCHEKEFTVVSMRLRRTKEYTENASYLAPLPFAKVLSRILFHALGEREERWPWSQRHIEHNQELQKYVASLVK